MKIASLLLTKLTVEGNTVTVYTEGPDAFAAMFDAIQKAEKKVWMDTYILKYDAIGKKTIQLLTDAAKRGCEVILIVDGLGSFSLLAGRKIFMSEFIAAGGTFIEFNPLLKFWNRKKGHSLLLRNHRKILIVDDKIGTLVMNNCLILKAFAEV